MNSNDFLWFKKIPYRPSFLKEEDFYSIYVGYEPIGLFSLYFCDTMYKA